MGLVEKIKEIGKSNLVNYIIKPAFEYVILPAAILIGANEFANSQKWIDVYPGENLAQITNSNFGDPDIRYRLHEGEYITQYFDGIVLRIVKLSQDQELYGTISFVNPPDIMTNQVGLDIDKEKSTILKGQMEIFGAKIYNCALTDIDIDNLSNNSDVRLFDGSLAENFYVFSGVAPLRISREIGVSNRINNCVINDVNTVGVNTDVAGTNSIITNSLFKHINSNAIVVPATGARLSTTTDDGCIFRPLGADQTNIYNSSMSDVFARNCDWGLDDIFGTPAGITSTIINEGVGSTVDYSNWCDPGSKLYIPIDYGQIGPTDVDENVWNAYWNFY